MKFKDGVIITKNGDEHIIVFSGEVGQAFSGMIKTNRTRYFYLFYGGTLCQVHK